MRVVVVGGADSFVRGNLTRKLDEHGVEVVGHLAQTLGKALPAGTEGVVIIKDMVSHAMAGQAVDMAKASGVPVAMVQRKFSSALPVLRAKGIVEPESGDSSTETEEEELPTFADVVDERVATDPQCLLDEDQLAQDVLTELGLPGSQGAGVRLAIRSAHRRVREQWGQTKHELYLRWLERRFAAFLAGREPWPAVAGLRSTSRAIFGTMVADGLISEVKARTVGSWAQDLVPLGAVQRYATSTYPELHLVVSDLVAGEELPTVVSSGATYSSTSALDEVVARWRAAGRKPPEPEEPQLVVEEHRPDDPAPEPQEGAQEPQLGDVGHRVADPATGPLEAQQEDAQEPQLVVEEEPPATDGSAGRHWAEWKVDHRLDDWAGRGRKGCDFDSLLDAARRHRCRIVIEPLA